MKTYLTLILLLVSNLCIAGSGVKLYLFSFSDDGNFTVAHQLEDGSHLLKLGISLNVNKADVVFIEDLNSSNGFCSSPYPYHLKKMSSSSTFDNGTMIVLAPMPCTGVDLMARLKLIVLDENKITYADTLEFTIQP